MNDEKCKAWRMFEKYWDNTDWGGVSIKEVEKLIGNYITFPIPKNINKEEVGNKFFALVKESFMPMIHKTPLQNSVFKMYERLELGTNENEHCRKCRRFCKVTKKDLVGPISFFHIGTNFDKDKYKIVFVGKNTWYDLDGYNEDIGKGNVADARELGLDIFCKPPTAFGIYIKNVVEKLYHEDGMKNIAVTNMVKCNTTGQENNPDDKTPKTINDNCISGCKVIKKEMEILKPKRIIFMTGKRKDGNDYDKYIKSFKFGYSEWVDGEDVNIDDKNVSWQRTLFNKNRNDFLFILRVSHPQGKNKRLFIENIINWVNTTYEVESFSKLL